MDKERIKKLWLKSKEYNTILILDIIMLILAIMLVIFYKTQIINRYMTLVLSLIILFNAKLSYRLYRKKKKIFYSKYGYDIDIRKKKKR
jgi:general stress protein CsbA